MLLEVCSRLPFESRRIERFVDDRRRYDLELDPRFPLAVQPLSYVPSAGLKRFNWHERLELCIVAAGRGRFRMGERLVPFDSGDILVVDNLKLHGVEDWRGPERRALVITFMPELVCSPASYACDLVYLLPFYSRPVEMTPALRCNDACYDDVQASLARLVECYFGATGSGSQAGVKAHLIEALYSLAKHFGISGATVETCDMRRRQSLRFGRLWEYLRENAAEPITVADAARMTGLSESQFMRFFKNATGKTFVTYVNELRLANAYRLLTETQLSIAEIAARSGYADQSYFDRRFRSKYKQSPRELRQALKQA